MSKPMYAIVIMYQGNEPSVEETAILSKLVNDHLGCIADPMTAVLTPQDLAIAAVVKASPSKPHFSTEEGDNAVAILDKFTDKIDRADKSALSLLYYRMLVRATHDHSDTSQNFIKALSVISQGMPISSKAKAVHHISPEMIAVAKQVYSDYNA